MQNDLIMKLLLQFRFLQEDINGQTAWEESDG